MSLKAVAMCRPQSDESMAGQNARNSLCRKGLRMNDHPTPPDASGTGGMSVAARERVLADLANGRDTTNAQFLFATTSTSLLLAAAAGLIDAVLLARRELVSRGLDGDGEWCGFEAAARIHGVQR